MKPQHADVLKLLIALQVAVLEHDSDNLPAQLNARALQNLYARLGVAIKALT